MAESGEKDERPRKTVLITDLDNTLYDWVEIWSKSFSAMIDQLAVDSEVNRDQLLDEIKAVHQKHRTSEYAFLIEELPCLQKKHPSGDLAKIYDKAIHRYRSARKRAERLYPAVLETLRLLHNEGVTIVGYTESMAFYSARRIKKFGLDGVIDYLYSPPDHDLPQGMTPEQLRTMPLEQYALTATEHRHTPKNEIKPNPGILRKIVSELGVDASDCIYVGDSLMKDVAMAIDAGLTSVHAKYGIAQGREEYELLRRVTHWSSEDVQREREIQNRPNVVADITLTGSFAELLAFVDFQPAPRRDTATNIATYVDIWKKVVDVQQHFNDIEIRIRTLAVTTLTAILGAAGYAQKESIGFAMFGAWLNASSVILIVGFLVWMVFYLMDRFWYHRLLYGAVANGGKLEKAIQRVIPEMGLGEEIGRQSPVTVNFGVGKFTFHSGHKMDFIYLTLAFGLAALAVVFW
ncbi:MAG: HAD family hydrolase [Rhodospirillales bacterium]|nr:MAG: HAD family hydrolase [Rhodospirillales bacterium]